MCEWTVIVLEHNLTFYTPMAVEHYTALNYIFIYLCLNFIKVKYVFFLQGISGPKGSLTNMHDCSHCGGKTCKLHRKKTGPNQDLLYNTNINPFKKQFWNYCFPTFLTSILNTKSVLVVNHTSCFCIGTVCSHLNQLQSI